MLICVNGIAQTRMQNGIALRENFKTLTASQVSKLQKRSYDTLQYKTLEKTLSDFTVNSGCGEYGSDQDHVTIARDDRGGFLCAWEDTRTGRKQVDAQLFDAAGNRLGTVLHVSETTNEWNSEPHLVYNRVSGEYLVLWAESGYDIRGQRISRTGELVGNNVTVNQTYASNTNNPSAAIDSLGNFLVTWTADVTYWPDDIPYCRVLDKECIPVSNQWSLVNSGEGQITSFGWDDRIAGDGAGRCVVVWSTLVGNRSRIALQQIDRTGNVLGHWVVASDPADTTDHYFPTVASTRDGTFLILWSSDAGVEGRLYKADSGFVGPQMTVAALPHYWTTYVACSDDSGRFFIIWTSDRQYGRTVSSSGALGPAVPLAFETTVPWWYYPHVVHLPTGRLSLVYRGYVRNQMDVMLQALDVSFGPIGASSKIADDGCSASQTNPLVRFNQEGRALVIWNDRRNGYPDLYGRVIDEFGMPVSDSFLINDTSRAHWPDNYVIVPDENGNFIVAFSAGGASDKSVTLQKVSAAGARLGASKTGPTDYSAYEHQRIALGKDANDNILVCWHNANYATGPVYGQKFGADFTPSGSLLTLLNGSGSFTKEVLSFSVNSRLDILTVWLDHSYPPDTISTAVKGMIFDSQGRAISDTLVLDNVAGHAEYYACTSAIDDQRNIAVVGYDESDYGGQIVVLRRYAGETKVLRYCLDLYARTPNVQIAQFSDRALFVTWNADDRIKAIWFDDKSSALVPLLLQVMSPPPTFDTYTFYGVDLLGEEIAVSYQSVGDPQLGLDVFMNKQSLRGIDTGREPLPSPMLTAEYPNPSSGIVTLKYTIGAASEVNIAVYNTIGQKVREVQNAFKDPGTYTVQFDTRGMASGLYFIRYWGTQSATRKFLVIK